MRASRIPVGGVVLCVAALSACPAARQVDRLCSPGSVSSCSCDGGVGQTTCLDDGTGYGSCSCHATSDAGPSSDAGPVDAGPFCTPDSHQDCTCPDNRSGQQACNSAGTAWDSCVCDTPPACTMSSLAGNGSVTFGSGSINYTSTEVLASFHHFLGTRESGCLSVSHFVLSQAEDTCQLTLDFGGVENGSGGLTQVSLLVDSLCAEQTGLPTGKYVGAPGYGLIPVNLTTTVPDSFSSRFCLQSEFISFGSGSITLTSDGGTTITISLGTLSILGALYSEGDSNAACYSTAMCGPDYRAIGSTWCKPLFCNPGQHDGGDGNCVPIGTCTDGYHDGGNGTCVAQGACLSGYHDGGAGECVASGTCSAGYHDGGQGLCVTIGICDFGYHDGGNGSCVAEGTCATGYTPDTQGDCIPSGDCTSAPAVASPGFERSASVGSVVTLDGGLSRGAPPLSFHWAMVQRPGGSTAVLSSASGAQVTFVPDVQGDYRFELSITDARSCVSSTSSVTIHSVVRPPSIVVRATWDADHGDLDLHYLAPGGTYGSTTLDCYYSNSHPAWGPNGVSDGDGRNDPVFGGAQPSGQSADQRDGGSVGESVAHPGPGWEPLLFDGVFTPEVHYYCPTSGTTAPVTAVIHVLVDGSEVYTQSRLMNNGDTWPAASIQVSGGGTSVNVSASGLTTTHLCP